VVFREFFLENRPAISSGIHGRYQRTNIIKERKSKEMSIEHSLKVVDAAIEEFNERDWDRFGELHAQDVVLTAPSLPEPAHGRPAVREWAKTLATAFPDLHWEPIRSFGQDNEVAVEIIATGTHKGPLMGPSGEIPATNKPVRMSIGAVFTVKGDEAAEVHIYNDMLGLLIQLGLAP
jgi:steroid delta-isomerase-like uncharacterized protein